MLVLGVLLAAAGAASPVSHRILFVDTNAAVQTVDLDSGAHHVLMNDGAVTSLAWSPDGTRLLVVDAGGLNTVSTRTHAYTHLVSGVILTAAWSPNGHWVAALLRVGTVHRAPPLPPPPRYAIFLVRPSGRGLHRVTPWSTNRSGDLLWSPDSTRLLSVRGAALTVLDLTGKSTVVKDTGYVDSAAWSPDGRTIAYGRLSDYRFGQRTLMGLWLVGPDGRGLRQLTQGTEFSPEWSPDGTRIAFVRIRPDTGDYALGSVVVGTGAITPLDVEDHYVDDNPSWSPDGRWLAFGRRPAVDGTRDQYLWVVRTDGTGAREISHHMEPGTEGTWQPR